MRGTIHRLTAPIVERLPDLTNVPPRRQITGALLVSVILHLLGATVLVALAWLLPQDVFAEAKPKLQEIELQIIRPEADPEPTPVALASAPVTPVIDPKGLEESTKPPEQATFQSSQDMVAGSERAGKGMEPLPTQAGADLPFTEFKNQQVSLGPTQTTAPQPPQEKAEPPKPAASRPMSPLYNPRPLSKQYLEALAKHESASRPPEEMPVTEQPAEVAPPPSPIPPPEERVDKPNDDQIALTPAPQTTPAPRATPLKRINPSRIVDQTPPTPRERESLAMLTTPPPRPPPPTNAGFQPELRQTRIEGSISNRGRPGVDAKKTPLGVYQHALSAQIHQRWLIKTKARMDLLQIGTARLRFFITPQGRVQDVRVVSNDSNSTFGLVCEEAVREAEIAPPPSDLEVMKDGRLELVFSFTLY